MNLLTIGKIINVRGLQGEVKIAPLTDFSTLRYRKGNIVYLEANRQMLPLKVKSYHHSGGFDYVQFVDFNTIEQVKPWMNLFLYAEKDALKLQANTYFYTDLLGCKIIDQSGEAVGQVDQVESLANRTLLRMKRSDKPDVLIPFIDAFILKVDLQNKSIQVAFIEGML
jgi:16S rRNA processing protein RimM